MYQVTFTGKLENATTTTVATIKWRVAGSTNYGGRNRSNLRSGTTAWWLCGCTSVIAWWSSCPSFLCCLWRYPCQLPQSDAQACGTHKKAHSSEQSILIVMCCHRLMARYYHNPPRIFTSLPSSILAWAVRQAETLGLCGSSRARIYRFENQRQTFGVKQQSMPTIRVNSNKAEYEPFYSTPEGGGGVDRPNACR